MARSRGDSLPAGLFVNSNGESSTSPEEYYASPPLWQLPERWRGIQLSVPCDLNSSRGQLASSAGEVPPLEGRAIACAAWILVLQSRACMMLELNNCGGLDSFFSNPFLDCGAPLQSGNWRTKSPKRRRRSGLSVSTENIEPRVALTMIMPTPMPGMYQPPAVTGQVALDVNYQYFPPDLVFNGVGDRAVPGIVRYDSTVPFLVNGHSTRPADLKLTFPNGNLMQMRVNGPFSFQFPISTAMSPTTAMTMQTEMALQRIANDPTASLAIFPISIRCPKWHPTSTACQLALRWAGRASRSSTEWRSAQAAHSTVQIY